MSVILPPEQKATVVRMIAQAEYFLNQAREHGLRIDVATAEPIHEMRQDVGSCKLTAAGMAKFDVAFVRLRHMFQVPWAIYPFAIVLAVLFVLCLLSNYQLDYYSEQLGKAMEEAKSAQLNLLAASVRVTMDQPILEGGLAERSRGYFPIDPTDARLDRIDQRLNQLDARVAPTDPAAPKKAETGRVQDIAFIVDILTLCNHDQVPSRANLGEPTQAHSRGFFEGNYNRSVLEQTHKLSESMDTMLNYAVKLNIAEHAFPVLNSGKAAQDAANEAERHPLAKFGGYIGGDRIISMPADPIDLRSTVLCKLRIYPSVRSFASNILSNKLAKDNAVTLYLLPTLTALLGTIFHILYFYRKDLETKPSNQMLYLPEQLLAGLLIGATVSLLVPLLSQWHGPLTALGFLCGLLSEGFGLFLLNSLPGWLHIGNRPEVRRPAQRDDTAAWGGRPPDTGRLADESMV